MTILNVTPTASITADATPSITSLPFTFEIFQTNQIKVTVSNTVLDEEQTLVLGVGYTVTLDNRNLPKSSGRVDLLNPLNTPDYLNADGTLKDGWTLSLQRVVPIDQRTAFNNLGPFFPRSLEDSLDKLTMIIQDIIEGGAINIDAGAVIDFTLFGLTVTTSGDMVTLQITYSGQAVGASVTFAVGGGGTGDLDFSMLTLTVDGNGVLTLSDGTDSISADLSTLITTHNTDTTAHQDIRDSVGTAVTTHNAANDAHQDIRDSVDTAVTTHNTDANAHQSIRDGVDTSIETHNTSDAAHNDIRTSIQNIINAGAIPVWAANTAYNVNDILSDSGTLYRVTTAGTSAATIAEDISGGLNLVSMTAHRADLSDIEAIPRRESAVYFATDTEEWLFDDGTDLHRIGSGAALMPDLSNLPPELRERLALRGKGLEFESRVPQTIDDLFTMVPAGMDIGTLVGVAQHSGTVIYLTHNGWVSNSADQIPNISRYTDFNSIGVIDGEIWYSAQIDGSTNHQLFRFISGTEEVSTAVPTTWDVLDYDYQDDIAFILAHNGTDLMIGRKEDGQDTVWRGITIPPGSPSPSAITVATADNNTFYLGFKSSNGTDAFLGRWNDSGSIDILDEEYISFSELTTEFNGFIFLNGGFVAVSDYYAYDLPLRLHRHTRLDAFSDQDAEDEKGLAANFGDTAIRRDTNEIIQFRGGWQIAGTGTRMQNLATDLNDAEKREAGIRLGLLLGANPREDAILEGIHAPRGNRNTGSVTGAIYSGIISSFHITNISTASDSFDVTEAPRKMNVTYRGQQIDAFIVDNLDQVSLFIDRSANVPISALPSSIRVNVEGGNLGTGTLLSTSYLTTTHTYRKGFDTRNISADVATYRGGTGNLNIPVGARVTEIITTGGEISFELAPVGQVYAKDGQIYLEYSGTTIEKIWRYNSDWREILDLTALNADDLQNLQDTLNEKENLILTGTGAPASDTAGKANQWLFVIPTDTLTEIWRNDGTEDTPNWAKKIDFDDFATNTALQTTNNNVALLNTSVSTLSTTVNGKMEDDFSNVVSWDTLTDSQRTNVLESLFRGMTTQALVDLHARIFATVNGTDRVSLFHHMVRGTSMGRGEANQSPSINADNDDMIWVNNLRTDLSNVGTVTEDDQQAFRQAVGLGAADDVSQPQNLYGTREPIEIEGVPITNPALGKQVEEKVC